MSLFLCQHVLTESLRALRPGVDAPHRAGLSPPHPTSPRVWRVVRNANEVSQKRKIRGQWAYHCILSLKAKGKTPLLDLQSFPVFKQELLGKMWKMLPASEENLPSEDSEHGSSLEGITTISKEKVEKWELLESLDHRVSSELPCKGCRPPAPPSYLRHPCPLGLGLALPI